MQRVCLGEAPLLKKGKNILKGILKRGQHLVLWAKLYVSSSIFPGFYLKKGENNSGYFRLLAHQ